MFIKKWHLNTFLKAGKGREGQREGRMHGGGKITICLDPPSCFII